MRLSLLYALALQSRLRATRAPKGSLARLVSTGGGAQDSRFVGRLSANRRSRSPGASSSK